MLIRKKNQQGILSDDRSKDQGTKYNVKATILCNQRTFAHFLVQLDFMWAISYTFQMQKVGPRNQKGLALSIWLAGI